MDKHIILVEKITYMENLIQDLELEDVSIIFGAPVRINFKGPVKITTEPRVAPLIITTPGPIPYSYDKAILGIMEVVSTTMESSENFSLLKVEILKLSISALAILLEPVKLLEVEGFSL